MSEGAGAGAEDILRAAIELFAQRGYDAVSISTIAERAGSSKANVFHHFGNKRGLYFAVMRETAGRLTDEFSRLLDSNDDPAAKIEKAIRASLAVLFEDECRSRLIFREVLESGPGESEALAKDVFNKEFAALSALFADIRDRTGARDAIDPSFLAYVFLSANVMFFHCRQLVRHMPDGDFVDDRDRYVAMVRELLLRGVGPGRNGDDQ